MAGRGANIVRREMTAEVLEAFAEATLVIPIRTAGLTQKIKQLWDLFQKAPQKWEEFKKMVGVQTTSWVGVARELPGLIRDMLSDAKKYLESLGKSILKSIPVVDLYLDLGKKMPSVGDWLNSAMSNLPPAIQKALSAITSRFNSLAKWLDNLEQEYHFVKPASRVVKGGLFAYIWFNVTELSWDIPAIISGFLGNISFTELLQSLPESGLGLIIGIIMPGIPGGLIWNALLPITLAMRIAWMLGKKYITWNPGRDLTIHWDRMGVSAPSGVPSSVRI